MPKESSKDKSSKTQALKFDERKHIGFLMDKRRLNVAITRAKHMLMIVGCGRTLSNEKKTWAPLMQHFKKRNALFEVPASN